MSLLTNMSSSLELLIKLLEVIIWPITLLIIILLFRRKFSNAISRLGSIKADSSGISMTFESMLGAAKAKFTSLKPDAIAKSEARVLGQTVQTQKPYKQLVEIKAKLEKTLVDLAEEEGMEVAQKSSATLCKELEQRGIISRENSALMVSLMEVVNAAPLKISQDQVDDIKAMYNSI